MKSGQVIEYNNRNIFFKNHTENEAGRLVPDHFLFFKKAGQVAGKVSRLYFVYDFSRKFFVMLHSINRPNVIA